MADTLPAAFAEIVDDFTALAQKDRLELLLEFSRELPALPERYAGDHDAMEAVTECQSPVFVRVETGATLADEAQVYFDAPAEAPTTRGFASILATGLAGLSGQEILDVPNDVPQRLGLSEAVSPLRLRGMAGMLARIKRQVKEGTPA
ncbi:cysteine desufuration protein SufE [Kineosporia sp. NBRC 101677]|uniref:SufE family protein n=1 Tax=Kineosporia sp. NBRC 101677 TaxID=3032197 RepID=UPI0024A18886|nr:SufE family protein [Kineosporia sp. NBRC 101677]GLY17490.1 cysteine desufuration protein SufE [Kineosporia sp. NBRC 101677]